MAKTALITGASKGIGLALAKQLLEKGLTVLGTSRSGRVKIEHQNFQAIQLDLAQKESIEQFGTVVASQNLKIDWLLNNAGIGPDLETSFPEQETFEQTFDVNVKGTVFFTESMLDRIKTGGLILNVSSKMGSIDYCKLSDSVAYRMSKSALNMYTKILANRLKDRIRVASIHPGWVVTTIAKSNVHARLKPEESAEKIIDYIENKLSHGDFWDAERAEHLKW